MISMNSLLASTLLELLVLGVFSRVGGGGKRGGDIQDKDGGPKDINIQDYKYLFGHYEEITFKDFKQSNDPFQKLENNQNNNNNSHNNISNMSMPFINLLSLSSSSSTEIYLPDIIWRDILNYLVIQYFREPSPGEMVQDSPPRNHYMKFISLSLVCKRWSNNIIPFLGYGEVKINSQTEFALFARLVYRGISGVPLQFTALQLTLVENTSTKHVTDTLSILNTLSSVRLNKLTITINFQVNSKVVHHIATLIQKSRCKSIKLSAFQNGQQTLYPKLADLKGKGQFHYLEEIDIGGSRAGDLAVVSIEQFINHSQSKITVLNLESCALGQKGLTSLCVALASNNTIHTLNLSFNRIGDEVSGLTNLVATKKNITSLNLNENRIAHHGGIAISQLLDQSDHLKTLILSTNPFSSTSLALILSSISQNIGLEKVSLAMMSSEINLALLGNCFTNCEAVTVGGYTRRYGCSLRSFNVMVNDLGKNGDFFKCILDNTKLAKINLSNTKLKGEARTMLATTLAGNSGLKKIDLSYALTESDNTDIMRALIVNSSITSINLSLNSLRSDEGEILGQVLTKNTTLTSLNLGNNILGRGCIPILQALKTNKTLKHLNLRKNLIRDMIPPGLLFQVLCQNTTLKYFDLCQNFIGNRTGKEIGFALPYNNRLKYLDLSSNQLSHPVALVFLHSLKYNQSLTKIGLSGNILGGPVVALLKQGYIDQLDLGLVNDYGPSSYEPIVPPTPLVQNQPKKRFFFF
ncbi:hypothetical protein DFA_11959 [Cavenderia fasciculata]|uniref:Leucine-rich repeat-containing protein n=1 Tax=Cavenderia fasciculata TaxID=261658 RepID=F4QEY3_CACFS|nr:uncharacterized protein DFA_11959 [Cavenderia fasciculata]EGG14190.1 hypothetical protein DFA_11959 [Cavenderia fasciculata]|eukprot:XP_004350898.1 hypothetical protein DFA_11959 [Cavenderia fasciculata]